MIVSQLDYKTLAVDGSTFLLYRKGCIYVSYHNGELIEYVAKLPISREKMLLSKFRLTTRLFRLEPRCACVLGEGRFLISYSGGIYRIKLEGKCIEQEYSFRKNMNNPLSITRVFGVAGFDDGEYFGEYFSNNSNEEVCVYKRTDGKYEKIYSFPPKTVYHIHGITADKVRNCLYVLTGDKDNESAIWEVRDHFNSVKPILIGRQKYRACVAFPYKSGILYATDTSREQNYLYYAEENNGMWSTEIVDKIPGPCIYGTSVGGDYFFATSVEPDDTLSERKFRYTYKLGKGVSDRYTHIIKVDRELNTSEVFRAKKDMLPMLLFQFGNCLFPAMENADQLVVCPASVCKFDGKSVMMSLEEII